MEIYLTRQMGVEEGIRGFLESQPRVAEDGVVRGEKQRSWMQMGLGSELNFSLI